MKKIVVVDFAGTLIKKEIIEEANSFRAQILQRDLPSVQEHAQNKLLYKNNRDFVERLTGVRKRSKILYRSNDGREVVLSGEQAQNQMATNLFQIGMYMAAKKHGKKIFSPDFLEVLKKIKKKGYALAIVSGVRTDIISGMLEIVGVNLFDFIKGQPPMLGIGNEELLQELTKEGEIVALIGDKKDDLLPAKKFQTKAVFVTWGTPQGGEEKMAKVVRRPEELLGLF